MNSTASPEQVAHIVRYITEHVPEHTRASTDVFDIERRPTAWDVADDTGLPIQVVRAALDTLDMEQRVVVSTHTSGGHCETFYSPAA